MLIFIDFFDIQKKSGSPNVFQGLGFGHNPGQIEGLGVGIPRGGSKCTLKRTSLEFVRRRYCFEGRFLLIP